MSSEDRPFFRKIIKAASRLLFGSARAHFQDRFPGLRIDGGATGAVFYRNAQIARLLSVDILGEGQSELFIVGSGPSVSHGDFASVPPDRAILLNGALHLMGREIARPLAVAIEDERFVWRHYDLMCERISPGTICLFSVQVLRALCEHDPAWLADKRIVLIDNIAKPYGVARRKLAELAALDFVAGDDAGDAALSLRPQEGVFQGGSVAISALQFAMACKPGLIGLFGIDIANADTPRFYEQKGGAAFSGIASAEARILRYFDLGRRVCADRGIRLECYSPTSALLKVGYVYNDRFAVAKTDQPR